MTDPNDPVDQPAFDDRSPDPAIERLLVDTFDHRAVRLGRGRPDLDGVLTRVRHRRRRRRTVAVLGSVAVLGGGVVGLTQLADGNGNVTDQLAGTSAASEGAWSCTDPLPAGDDGQVRFESCVQLDDLDSAPVPTTTITPDEPMTVDPTTAPGAVPATTTIFVPATVPAPNVPATVPGIDVREVVVISPTEQTHTVVENDSLFAIGRLFDVPIETLANYNGWPDGVDHVLLPGEEVLIPPDARVPVGEGQGGILIYTVRAGDTATAIARTFGVSLGELAAVNEWTDAQLDQIQAGDEIVIPPSSPVAGS